MLQNQGKQRVRRRRSAGKRAVFMDVISLMVRVSGLTSSSYSAPSCRGPPVTRPVEMRLYHHHTSHRIRCVRGHFKKKKMWSSFIYAFPYRPPSFPSISFPLSHTHTHGAQMDTNSDMLENNPGQFRFLGERSRGGGGDTTCLTSFSSNPVISTGSVQVIHSVFVVE